MLENVTDAAADPSVMLASGVIAETPAGMITP